jgi:hypothetical protein
MTTLLALITIAGAVPRELVAPARVAWIGAKPSQAIVCLLQSTTRWSCDGIPPDASGVVVIVGDGGIASIMVEPSGAGNPVLRRWGRAIYVQPASGVEDDLGKLQVTSWVPDRSSVRLLSTRFVPMRNTDVDITRLAPGIFWIAGDDVQADAFLSLDAAAFATTRIPIDWVLAGDVESPVYVIATLPSTLTGRVQDSRGADVADTDVELFELLVAPVDTQSVDDLLSRSMIRTGRTRSGDDGTFSFERLASGPFVIMANDADRGRGVTIVRSLAEPVVVRLSPPLRVTGRVLRHQLPVTGARLRFVPDADAFRSSTDGHDLTSQEQVSGSDGRFELAFPPLRSGMLQVVAPDGAAVRVSVVGNGSDHRLALGDIALPDPRRVIVRVLGGDACVLFAAGPVGQLGMTVLRESAASDNLHWFDVPEAGQWALDADCQGRPATVDPPLFAVSVERSDVMVDVHIIR